MFEAGTKCLKLFKNEDKLKLEAVQ